MEQEMLDVIFCGLLAGGKKLNRAKLGFSGSKATPTEKELLKILEEKKLIAKEGRNFNITKKAEEYFRAMSSKQRILELEEKRTGEFLQVVAKKNGKKLTAVQMRSVSAKTIEKAIAKELVEKLAEGKFQLNARGNSFLQCRIPLKQALQNVDAGMRQLEQSLNDLSGEMEKQEAKISIGQMMQPVIEQFEKHRAAIEQDMEKKRQLLQDSVDSACLATALAASFEQAKKEVATEMTSLKQEMQGQVKEIQQDYSSKHREMQEKLSTLQKDQEQIRQITQELKNYHANENTATTKKIPPAVLDIEQVKKSMEKCYRQLLKTKHLTQIVSFPELYQQVVKEWPMLTVEKYKEILDDLCRDVIVDLHSVYEKSEVKQPQFAIKTTLGELYYVSWRS